MRYFNTNDSKINIFIYLFFITLVSCLETETLIPAIITINPDFGRAYDLIVVNGTGFGEDTSNVSVTFNGKNAAVKSLTDTLIKVFVPENAGTGLVKVIIGETEIIGPEFNYIEIIPTITGIVPNKGTRDDLITIYGTDFGYEKGLVSVTFNDKTAKVKSVTDTKIEVFVPVNAGTGKVKLIIGDNEITGPEFFYEDPDPADVFTEAVNIGDGSKPAIVIDPENRIIHLAYIDENKVMYRQGDLNGNFGIAEEVLTSQYGVWARMWQPVIVLDENKIPHITVSDANQQWNAKYIYYTNRIGGTWSSKLVVFDVEAENLYLGGNAFITTEGNTVYLVAFLVDGENPDFQPSNAYVRIDNVDTSPVISIKEFTTYFATAFLYLKDNGELWTFRGGGSWASRWIVQQMDKATMMPIGDEILFLDKYSGEQVRWLYDKNGEIHAAGATYALNNPTKEGWYQTLSRATKGLAPLKYKTSNFHANGGAQPVRDLKAANRVYVTYWNGEFDVDRFGKQGENPWGCTVENQINFMRVENGEKVKEGRKITDRTWGIHGTSYRTAPAAAAHPDGGMVIVFPECGEKNNFGTLYNGPMQLFFTHIGKVN